MTLASRAQAGILKVITYNLDLSGGMQALGKKKAQFAHMNKAHLVCRAKFRMLVTSP